MKTVKSFIEELRKFPEDMEIVVANWNGFIDDIEHSEPELELTAIDKYNWFSGDGRKVLAINGN